MAKIGDTIRITAEFTTFAGELQSPTNIMFRAYDGNRQQIAEALLAPYEEGKVRYDFIVPSGGVGPITIEISGVLEELPIVGRQQIARSWI